MKKSTLTLAAAALIAMAFTACGGSKPVQLSDATGDDSVEVSSPRGKLLDLCNEKFDAEHYCGIGQGVSTSEQMAAKIAATNARGALVQAIEDSISSRGVTQDLNDTEAKAIESAANKIKTIAEKSLRDIKTQKEITLYSKTEKKYTVNVLITTSRAGVNNMAENNLAGEELESYRRVMMHKRTVDDVLE